MAAKGENIEAFKNQIEQADQRLPEDALIDELDEIVYISDVKTYELIYVNRAGRDCMGLEGKEYIGKKCYRMIQNMDKPCDFCTNSFLEYDNFYIWEHTNSFLNRHYLLKDKLVDWYGQPARMELAVDITDKENISQSLKTRLEREQSLVSCIHTLVSIESLDEAVDLVLANAGEFYQADRVYIVEGTDALSGCCTFEWCAQGTTSLKGKFQNIYFDDFPYIKSVIKSLKAVILEDTNLLKTEAPAEYSLLKKNGICGMYIVPFTLQEKLMGYIAIDNPKIHKGNTSLLESLAYFIMNEVSNRRMSQRLRFTSYHDRLTGLANRNSYAEYLDILRKREFQSLGILVADINGLKELNQDFGHSFGDTVICKVARILTDKFGEEHVFRLSGDEYVVLLPDISQEGFLHKILEANEEWMLVEHGVSFGHIWNTDRDMADIDSTIRYVDELMLLQKQLYYRDTDIINKRHLPEKEAKLIQALKEGNFIVYLQPKVNLNTRELIGAEALVRYQDEENGLIMPDQFINTVEKMGSICYIDLFVFEEVCKILKRWEQEGRRLIPISLNFSRGTIMIPGLTKKMAEIHERYGVPKELMEIEVTESMQEMERISFSEIGKQIRNMGFGISLDDFGVKYSNASMLAILPLDILKIDRSLISSLTENDRFCIVVRHVIELCREMGIQVIAEGVETEEQRELLIQLGCCFSQGYLFGKPMPLERFECLESETYGYKE